MSDVVVLLVSFKHGVYEVGLVVGQGLEGLLCALLYLGLGPVGWVDVLEEGVVVQVHHVGLVVFLVLVVGHDQLDVPSELGSGWGLLASLEGDPFLTIPGFNVVIEALGVNLEHAEVASEELLSLLWVEEKLSEWSDFHLGMSWVAQFGHALLDVDL